MRERPTASQVELLDLDGPIQPFPGQRILAITEGNKLIETCWSESLRGTLFAWSAYPKVPKSVKEKMSAHYFRNVINMEETLS